MIYKMESFKESKNPKMKRLHTKGYVMNEAAKNAMYHENGVWYVPINIEFASSVDNDSRDEVEDLLNGFVNKKRIAEKLGTNVYQLNRALKRWYGTSKYKDVLLKLRDIEVDKDIEEFTK